MMCPDKSQSLQKSVEKINAALSDCDAILIGAGAGLSTSAGFTYSGERFDKYFRDFHKKYGFTDMYAGGFYPYPSSEEKWAFWSRNIYINRYMDAPLPVYNTLLEIIKNKNYFVLTTNVDHCFQKAGFDKSRLFYTQGDYGLFQCSQPCHQQTYDNELYIRRMLAAQLCHSEQRTSKSDSDEDLLKTDFSELFREGDNVMTIPSELIPHCPKCGRPMVMNLRADDTFVEDDGWRTSAANYLEFLDKYKHKKIVFLELGVGGNTPVIIKYPFWQMTAQNSHAIYICINKGEAVAPVEIEQRSIVINEDIGTVLQMM